MQQFTLSVLVSMQRSDQKVLNSHFEMMRAIKQFESPYVQYLSITLQQNSVRYFFLVPKIAPGEVRKKCIFK